MQSPVLEAALSGRRSEGRRLRKIKKAVLEEGFAVQELFYDVRWEEGFAGANDNRDGGAGLPERRLSLLHDQHIRVFYLPC